MLNARQNSPIPPQFYERAAFHYPAGGLPFRGARLIVEVGQNEIEGAYVKLGYPYDAGRSASGLARLHLTTKRGVGAGVEHWFDTGQSAGEVNLFVEPSQDAWSTRLRHRYQFSRRLSTSFSTNLQTNSGYGLGTSTSLSSDFSIRNDTGVIRGRRGGGFARRCRRQPQRQNGQHGENSHHHCLTPSQLRGLPPSGRPIVGTTGRRVNKPGC